MMMREPKQALTPVFVLSGFLGSGKTTLLNRLLNHSSFANTAVVVNEFGEIGLDHLLIAKSTDNIVLLEAGCLCCTIADSLHETMADLNFRRARGEVPAFDRVIIETTGLADPAPILNTLLGNRLVTEHYRLEAVVVTVDAGNALSGLVAHREVAKQIAVADRLVITKLDLVDYSCELEAQLLRINPTARVLESRQTDVEIAAFSSGARQCVEILLPPTVHEHASAVGPQRGDEARHHHTPALPLDVNRHDAHIRADAFVLEAPPSWAGLSAWWRVVVELCGDRLLRCKGILEIIDSGEIVFVQGVQTFLHVPERLRGWPSDDHRSRLVCITRDVDPDELRLTLDALELPPGSDPNLSLDILQLQRIQHG